MAKSINPVIDPLDSPAYGLQGRIVTMQSENDIINDGIIYIDKAIIQAIVKKGDPVPDACKDLPVYKTKSTLFPGLVELHNHLSYNCLPMWKVPKKYGNRGQWSGIPEYRQLISGPMSILGKTPGYVEAIVRYVECKCLLAGVTTTQGIMLFSNAGIKKYYKGIVRNVEDTQDKLLPAVDTHIPDIASKDAAHFLTQLKKSSCLLLHLSEGLDASAHEHFNALKIDNDNWAITSSLAGIHCVALKAADYAVMKQNGASMVWSPLSNLLLYGGTADIKAAKASGITIGLGSDWAPSGSKNLLGELKVAKLFSDNNGGLFTNYEIISMATKNPAAIIHWHQRLGTLEKGKLADMLLIDGITGDPYLQLLHASEQHINLVVVNGTPRCGTSSLMKKFGKGTETRKIGKVVRTLNLKQPTADTTVGQLLLATAATKLKKGLKNLNKLSAETPPLKAVEGPDHAKFFLPHTTAKKAVEKPAWVLVLDHDEGEGDAIRPHLPVNDHPTMQLSKAKGIQKDVSNDLPEIRLDPLTVADDKAYFKNLANQMNLPDYIKDGIGAMYTGKS